MTIPGLCRVWTRVPAVDPYWVKMSYHARSYAGCLKIKQAYERRFPDREYIITADFDILQPLAAGPAPLSEDLAWRRTAT